MSYNILLYQNIPCKIDIYSGNILILVDWLFSVSLLENTLGLTQKITGQSLNWSLSTSILNKTEYSWNNLQFITHPFCFFMITSHHSHYFVPLVKGVSLPAYYCWYPLKIKIKNNWSPSMIRLHLQNREAPLGSVDLF